MKGKVLILIGAILVGVGFILLGVRYIGSNDKVRFVAPATSEVKLSKPGRYVIFLEENVMIGNTFYGTTDQLPDISVKVHNKEASVKVQGCTIQESYNKNGASGYGLLEFQVQNPGTYTVEVTYTNPTAERIVLAIETKPNHTIGGIIWLVVGGLMILLGIFGLVGILVYRFLSILQNG